MPAAAIVRLGWASVNGGRAPLRLGYRLSMPDDGSNVRRLTIDPTKDSYPVWSP